MLAKTISALAGFCATTFFVIAGSASVSALEVDSLSINISEHPTKNTNIFGTTFNIDGFVTDWGSDYMMIQLKLTSDPKFTFQNLYLDAVANRGQNTDPTNPLRFALFTQDPVLNNLNDSDALAKIDINQALIVPQPTFTDYLMGPAPGTINISPPDLVDPAVNDYYLMIYAGGALANQGYGLKVDKAAPVITFYAPDVPDPGLQVEYFNGTSFTTASISVPQGTPVPEPSTYLLCTLSALVLGSFAKGRKRAARSRS